MSPPNTATKASITLSILLALSRAALAAEDREMFRASSEYAGTNYNSVVMQSALDNAPTWRDDQRNPPISVRAAMSAAGEQLAKLLPAGAPWRADTITLKRVGPNDQWLYLVEFIPSPVSPNPTNGLIPRLPAPAADVPAPPFQLRTTAAPPFLPSFPRGTIRFRMVVLMDGTVVQPELLPPGSEPSMFQFAGADVVMVLEFYRELRGVELVVDANVPKFGAKITVGNRGTRDEAIQLLEKALREQVGVVFVRLDAKRVAVKFDETVKVEPEK